MFSASLRDGIMSAGLLQFGSFQHDSEHFSYYLCLDLLPSYPSILAHGAKAVLEQIASRPSRIVCTVDSIALATVVSQISAIPLVIHNGKPGQPAQNLIGAYDVGHAAILLSLNTDHPPEFIERLITEAASVGLHIIQWVSLVSARPVNEIRHAAAINLQDMAAYFVETGEVSAQTTVRIFNAG